jgi:hypothetical protein
VKYRHKEVRIRDAEGPSVWTVEYADGTAKLVLTFFTDFERQGVRTSVEHIVDFKLDYDELACVSRSLADCLVLLKSKFIERIDGATDSVRRHLNG